MSDRLSRLEGELAEIRHALGNVERRLQHLEDAHEIALATEEEEGVPAGAHVRHAVREDEAAPASRVDSTRLVTLTGRTLVILGAGHLLRAITDSGLVVPAVGVSLGLIYALSWLVVTRRAKARGRVRSAVAYGLSSAAIAFPLLWEAVTRFGAISPTLGAVAVGVAGLLFLSTAARWGLRGFAIVAALGTVVTCFALGIQTRALLPCALALQVVSGVALWIGWVNRWTILAWLTAPAANIAVLGVVATLGVEKTYVTPTAGWALGLSLFTLYLVSSIVRLRRSIWREGSLSSFELAQNVAAFVFGYGGAVVVSRWTGEGVWAIVAVSLVLVAASYGSSFASLAGPKLDRLAFSHYNTVALALVLAASWLALPTPWAVVLWSLLAVAGALMSSRLRRQTFGLHGAASVSAAGLGSGVVTTALLAFTTSPERTQHLRIPAEGWLALAAAVLGLFAFGVVPPEIGRRRAAFSRVVFWCVVLLGLGAVAVPALAPMAGEGETAASNLASLRTVVLAIAVTGLGLVSRTARFRDARWIVYPLLVITALKLVGQDLPHGRPTTLFISLGCFGLALILAARLVGRTRKA